MARVHKTTRRVQLDCDDDVWAIIQHVEHVLRVRLADEPARSTRWDVDVYDEGGTTTESDVAAARASTAGSRHQLKQVIISAFTRPEGGFERTRSIAVYAGDLNADYGHGPFSPNITVIVNSEDEADSIGLAEVLAQEIAYVRANPEVQLPSLAKARTMNTPVRAAPDRPSPVAMPAPAAITSDAAETKSWWRSARFWHHPWTVNLGTGLAVGLVILFLTLALT